MRLIQFRTEEATYEAVSDLLDEEDIDHVTTNIEEGGLLVQFPIPTQGVGYVLEAFDEAGIDHNYTVVLTAETADTSRFTELEERFVSGDEEDDSIARREIRSKALGMNPSAFTYYSMTLLSAVVAAVGLLLDSPAVVVGSMVIAPQVGSAMTASVGAALNDREMVVDGLRSQLFGLALAVVGAAAFGWAVKSAAFIPATLDLTTSEQISKRVSPGLLSAAVAVCAGAAGGFGLATALPVSLVGVMIAAALIPAAAAAGIGMAWGLPPIVRGSLALLFVNAVAINLSATAALWGLDYRPSDWDGFASFRRPRRFDVTFGTVAVLLVALLLATTAIAGHVAFTNTVNEEVESVIQQERFSDLVLLEVHTEFTDVLGPNEREVKVAVSRPADRPYPALAGQLASRLSAATDRRVIVEVEFVERTRAG